jgi:proliferating cell nuclear antigen
MQENNNITTTVINSEGGIQQVPKFATASKELGTFTNVVQAISTLVDEATFELTNEGLTFRGMDPSHVGLIDVVLPPNCFNEFAVGNATKFGVRIDELVKVLKKFDEKAGKVQFTIEDNKLVIKQEEQKVSLRLIESCGSSTPLPSLNFNAQFDLSKAGIKKFLKFLEFGEYTTLKATEHVLTLETKDDYGEYEHKYDNTQYLNEILVKEESKATFSNDYLTKVVKVLQAKNDSIKVEYSTKMPLRMEVRPFNVGTIHFYLAPRVQD